MWSSFSQGSVSNTGFPSHSYEEGKNESSGIESKSPGESEWEERIWFLNRRDKLGADLQIHFQPHS